MVYVVNAVKNLGFEPKSSIFMHVMAQMSESTWKKKIDVMNSLGWSEEAILWAFKKNLYCLSGSEEKIRSNTDFLVNTIKLGLETIIRQPKFLRYATDISLCPRYSVFRVLKSKNLIKGDKKIAQVLKISEEEL